MHLSSKIVLILFTVLIVSASAQYCLCKQCPNNCTVISTGVISEQHKRYKFEIVDLSFRNISTLEANIFNRLKVNNLILRNNNISKIATRSFAGISLLTSLNLEHNVIKTLQTDSIPATKNLYLDYNLIEALDGSMFASISTISVFSITNNRIAVICSDTFNNSRLTHLYLSFNRIVTIKEESFMGMQGFLKEIHLDGNGIEMIGRNSIPKAEIVYLNNNSLTSLTSNNFKNIFFLQYVDVRSNCLDEKLDKELYTTRNISFDSVRCKNYFYYFEFIKIPLLYALLAALSLGFVILLIIICKRKNAVSNIQSVNFKNIDNNRLAYNISESVSVIYDEIAVVNKPVLEYAEYENCGYLSPIGKKMGSYHKVG